MIAGDCHVVAIVGGVVSYKGRCIKHRVPVLYGASRDRLFRHLGPFSTGGGRCGSKVSVNFF